MDTISVKELILVIKKVSCNGYIREEELIKEINNRLSSNGRTTDFGSVNRGSSPCGLTIKHKWGTEDFLLATEGPDVFDPYAEDDCYDWWKD